MKLLWPLATNALIMSLVTACILLLRARLWRRIQPGTCYAIGMVLAIGLLIPLRPALPTPLPSMPVPQAVRSELALATGTASLPYDQPLSTASTYVTNETASVYTQDLPAEEQPSGHAAATFDPWLALAVLWLGGAMLYAGIPLARHVRFSRMVRRWHMDASPREVQLLAEGCAALGIRRVPALWRCGCIHTPMLVGLLRPKVLLPEDPLDADALRMILRHELVHLRRHDLICKAISLACVCLHWFNPLVRRLAHTISTDCEISCDAIVLADADATERRRYGEAILGVIERHPSPYTALSTHLFERRTDMKRRFASMLMPSTRRTGLLALVLVLSITLLSGSVLGDTGAPISPTTGRAYPQGRNDEYRPVLVSISNAKEARPEYGLSLADIVYEYVYWGPSHTRYLAIFNDYHPETVSSVRSTRNFAVDVLVQWRAPFVHAGINPNDEAGDISGQSGDYLRALDLPEEWMHDLQQDGTTTGVFSRMPGSVTPHNVAANVKAVVTDHWPIDSETGTALEAQYPQLYFTAGNQPAEDPVASISLSYDEKGEYAPSYAYNAQTNRYDRLYGGEAQIDALTGQRVSAANVIVQYMPLANAEVPQRIQIESVGGGPIDAFIGGRHISGSWSRASLEEPTQYMDENGDPLALLPGQTFIQIVPADLQIEYGIEGAAV